jgi:hypothetical protein
MLAVFMLLPVAVFPLIGRFTDTTNYENRKLADLPSFDAKKADRFHTGFETYFSDHLPFRNQLIFLNNYIDCRLFRVSDSDSVVIGRHGWLYYNGKQFNVEDPEADYAGTNLYSAAELDSLAKNLIKMRDELASKDCEFVVFIAPNKEHVYPENLPAAYGAPAEKRRMEQVVAYLKANTDLTVICPYDELLKTRSTDPDRQLYYKYDSHWNNLGSYIGSGMLDEALGHKMPSLDTLNITTARSPRYDLATMLHLGNLLTDDPNYVVNGFTAHTIKTEYNDERTEFRSKNENGDGDPRKLFIIGDSYSTMMEQYVACNFNETYLNLYYNYEPEMLSREKPQVLVYETVERYIGNMMTFSLDSKFVRRSK